MKLIRALLLDFKKAIVSKKFFLALVGAIIINFLNVADYIEIDPGVTVAYLFNIKNSTGGCLMCMMFLTSVPYASSFYSDYISNQYKFEIIRSNIDNYCISKAIVTVTMGAATSLLAYMILACILGTVIPIFPTNELAFSVVCGTQNKIFTGLLSTDLKWLYIVCIMFAESLKYGLLSGIALYVSTISRNPFVIFSSPIIVFYVWSSLFNMGIFPDILKWHAFDGIFAENIGLAGNMLFSFLYYSIFITIIGIAFIKGVKRRIENG